MVKKGIIFGILLCSIHVLLAQQNVNDCDNPSPVAAGFTCPSTNDIDVYELDLSSSPSDSGNFTVTPPATNPYLCCGGEHPTARCVGVRLILHPNVAGVNIRFIGNNGSNGDFTLGTDYCSADVINTSLNSIDNQGANFCLDGSVLDLFGTICKPGGASYCIAITSIAADIEGDDIIIADEPTTCATQVNVTSNSNLSNITWSSINGSLSYLDCPGPGLNCLDPIFTPPGNLGSPTTFEYEVCADYEIPNCGGLTVPVCDTVYIQVIPLVEVTITDIINCDYNYPYTVTASVTNPQPTFIYHWYDDHDGPNGSGTLIDSSTTPSWDFNMEGDYSLHVIDRDLSYTCPISVIHNFTITDLPQPPAIIIPPAVICDETDLTFEADQVVNSVPGQYTVSYIWTFPNSNIGIAFGPGPHTVRYDACGDKSATLEVTIESEIDNTVICTYSDTEIIPTDIVPPTITSHPADDLVACTSVPSWGPGDITATDNCSGVTIDTSSTITPGVCSGSYTITRVWTVTDNCGNSDSEEQVITVVDNVNPQVQPLTGGNFDCVASIPAPDPNIVIANDLGCGDVTVTHVGDVGTLICNGTMTRTYRVTDDCGNFRDVDQVFTLNDNIPPTISCPSDITLECTGEVPPLPSTYAEFLTAGGSASDNCGIVEGSFTYSESVAGSCPTIITRTFTIEDSCGASASCQWIINIEPPQLFWINPPADYSLTCGEADDFVPGYATYSNLEVGVCEITDSVQGVITSSVYDECGGSIDLEYTYVGECETITHNQTITVTRAPLPSWVSEEPDITITCDQALTFTPVNLDVSNGDDGSCIITATNIAPSNVDPQFDNCGGTITVDWSYTDPCGYVITSQQIVTVQAAPLPSWINPPGNTTISCDAAATYTAPDLDFSNASTESGVCIIDGTASPLVDNNFTECGGTITITWSATDDCGRPLPDHVQTITVNPAPTSAFVNPPGNISLNCEDIYTYDPGLLSYTNNGTGTCLIDGQVPYTVDSSGLDNCGGQVEYTWTFTDACNNNITHTQTVTVLPAAVPTWINPPGPVTLSCDQGDSYVAPYLYFTNNSPGRCLIYDSVAPVVIPNFTNCDGGTIGVTWTYTDECGNPLNHSQTITILAAPPAQWVNPPSDTTISCEDALVFVAPDLDYTNGEDGTCLISGTVPPSNVDPQFDECGGTIVIDWEFTDACNRQITHSQTITVDPAPIPQWVNPPAPITLPCEQAQAYVFPDLFYDNNAGATCNIMGSVSPTVDSSFTECDGTITATWTYTDPCNRTINHTQTITIDPAPQPQWTNQPGPVTITCDSAQNFVPLTLTYTNFETGNCEISGSIIPTTITPNFDECGGDIVIYWLFTDNCSRDLEWTQIVTVDPAPIAAFDSLPADRDIACDQAFAFVAQGLGYSNGESNTCDISGVAPPQVTSIFNECGGFIQIDWEFIDNCSRPITHTQVLNVLAAPAPAFDSLPANRTISCDEAALFTPQPLGYTNGGAGTCLIEGFAPFTVDSNFNECGGTLTITWDFVDSCGVPYTHTQILTVDPAPIAGWVNPPADVTISCNEADTLNPPRLQYTNSGSGSCLIEGFADPQVTPNFTECGGSIEVRWQFTDICGNPIEHIQNITVEPSPVPDWVNAPADTTITCDQALIFTAPDLFYTNTGIGACIISGSVPAQITPNFTECGGDITVFWEYLDPCGRPIEYTQIVTVDAAPLPNWVNPPDSISLPCAQARTYIFPDLDYDNSSGGTCNIFGTASPVVDSNFTECGGTITATWSFTDPCGRTDDWVQVLTVEPAPPAQWTNAPADTAITCDAAQNFVPRILNYNNGESAQCLISGSVTATTVTPNFDECGGDITVYWIYTDNCNRDLEWTQIVTVNPAPIAAFDSLPPNRDITCDQAFAFVAQGLGYSNGETNTCDISGIAPPVVNSIYNECGGFIQIDWAFTDNCGRPISHTQVLNVLAAPAPVFDSLPADRTISCDAAALFTPQPLGYTNGGAGTCLIEGFAPFTVDSNFNECGGTITITWQFTDSCGVPYEHIQTLTVEPAPTADWVNPPADVTITCNEADTLNPPRLQYTNSSAGSCLIEGFADPQVTPNFTECGGSIEVRWQFTDICGNPIEHIQNIAVEPSPVPDWVNAPADSTITCVQALSFTAPDLFYTNTGIGACIISGSVPAQITPNFTECGGDITVFWEYLDPCGRPIEYTQIVTVDAAPLPNWVNPPDSISLPCAQARTYIFPDLDYDNSSGGTCNIFGTASPVVDSNFTECGGIITATWSFTDPCGRTDDWVQVLTVEPAPPAQWTNAPVDTTITCDAAQNFIPRILNYNNGESAQCLISGTVTANTVTPNFDECGGDITVYWIYTDNCNRDLEWTQIVTVNPAPIAAFDSLPPNRDISCDQAFAFVAQGLGFSNGETNTCDISGIAPPIVNSNYNECGGFIQIDWEFTDNCGRPISHTQVLNVLPAPAPVFDSLPADRTISCDAAENYNPQPLGFTNLGLGTCLIEGEAPVATTPNFDECGGTITLYWNHTDSCGRTIDHTQVLTVEPAPEASWVNPPVDRTITCNEADTLTYPRLGYTNAGVGSCLIEGLVSPQVTPNFDECGGSIVVIWQFTDNCGRPIEWEQNIIVEPAPIAEWLNAPADTTISCFDAFNYVAPDLDYSNTGIGSCVISGGVPGIATPNFTLCGGDISVHWEFTDDCGRLIEHDQLISVEPALDPDYVDPPEDITIDCSDAINYVAPTLTITNNDRSSCLISDQVPGVVTRNFTECGGSITIVWEYVDACIRTFTHTQNITVLRSLQMDWINPPEDITITCAETEAFLAADHSLAYTNSDFDACLVAGSVVPTIIENFDECGGEITLTWEFTDNCNRTIEHTQLVSILPSPVASFTNVPEDVIMSCAEAVNYAPEDLLYSNAENGVCLIEGSVPGDVTNRYDLCGGEIEILWRFKDNCDRIIEHTQIITVEPTAPAVFDYAPEDITITCEEADDFEPESATYSNGDTDCLIQGSVNAFSVVNEYDQCGGNIYVYYNFQDECGRTIDHYQIVEVLPAPAPIFMDAPSDTTLSCELLEAFPIPDLTYTNEQSGSCIIQGNVAGVFSQVNNDDCNPEYEIVWEHTDLCGNLITHIQRISIIDTTAPVIIGTPPDVTVSCDEIPNPPLINNVIYAEDNCARPTLTFNEEEVPGECENTYFLIRTWSADDGCGNLTQAVQEITVICPPDLTIEIQPGDEVCEGTDVLFISSISSPYQNTVYQWQYSSNNVDWIDLVDENGDQLSIGSAIPEDAGYYRLLAADQVDNLTDPDCRVISNVIRLTIIPTKITNLTRAICEDEIVTIGSNTFNETGFYSVTLMASSGCDSIVNLDLTVSVHTTELLVQDICEGDNVVVGSEIFDITGIYTIVILNSNQCDSVITLDLTVHEPFSETRTEVICRGDSIDINGEVFTESGNYLISMQTRYGCDSLVSLNLTVIEPAIRDITTTICEGDSYTVGVETFNTSGNYTINLQAASGCDSIVNLDLTVTNIIEVEIDRVICLGNSYTFDGVDYSESGTYTATFISNAGCDSVVTLNLSVVEEIINEIEANICEGEFYEVDGIRYSESGIRFITLESTGGCDSLIILTVVVHESFDTTISRSICEGEFVEINGTAYNTSGTYDIFMQSAQGCDSTVHLILQVNEKFSERIEEEFCAGGSVQIGTKIYDETGIYIDSFQTNSGCDSVVILDLTIHPVFDTTITLTLCEGSSYSIGNQSYNATGVYNHTFATINGCDSLVTLDLTIVEELTTEIDVEICDGNTYILGSQTLTEDGTYSETFTSTLGCDSIVTVNLSTVPILTSTIDAQICPGETYTFSGTEYSSAGTYNHQTTSAQGCDSIATLNLTILEDKTSSFEVEICFGETYTYDNQSFSEEGTYDFVFQSSEGCDSLVTMMLIVNPVYLDTIEAQVCEGDSYDFDGNSLTSSGYYTGSGTSSTGCDSTTVLNLTVLLEVSETINAQICDGFFYRFGGEQRTETGQYEATFISSTGCDSVVTLNLEVVSELTETVNAQICEGSSYDFNGDTYSSSGSFSATLTSSLGCDSIVTLELQVLNEVVNDINVELCFGQTYQFDDEVLDSSGLYTKTYTTSQGCDSIVNVDLSVFPTYQDTIEATICEGESYSFSGQSYDNAGIYQVDLTSSDGCDSIVVLILNENPIVYYEITETICFDESYNFGTSTYSETGTYIETFVHPLTGCDSVVTLNLDVVEEIIETISVQICEGGSYEFNGDMYSEPGQFTAELISSQGCDSVVTLELLVVSEVNTQLDIKICEGESYQFDDINIDSTGEYQNTYPSSLGCDSVVTVTVTVYPTYQDTIQTTICEGSSYDFNGESLSVGGIYQANLSSIHDCDSIVILILNVNPIISLDIAGSICLGESYELGTQSLTESGVYTETLVNPITGCDSIVTLNLMVIGQTILDNYVQICEGSTFTFDGQEYASSTDVTATFISSLGCDSTVTLHLSVVDESGNK